MVKFVSGKMKIKSLGYKVIDEESGIVLELIPKTEEATQELVKQFFENFQVLIGEVQKAEVLKKERKRKVKMEKRRIEKKNIPNPAERQIRELADLPEEFAVNDIGDLFEKDGYDRKKIIDNAYHDIYNLIDRNKIIYIEDTKPKKYRIVSRDAGGL